MPVQQAGAWAMPQDAQAWSTTPVPRGGRGCPADMVAPMSHESEECMRRMAVGSALGFGVGGSVGALWGGAEIMR